MMKRLPFIVAGLISLAFIVHAGTIYRFNPFTRKLDLISDIATYIEYSSTTYQIDISTAIEVSSITITGFGTMDSTLGYGSSGEVLHTDGAGVLSWDTDDSGGGSGSASTLQVQVDGVEVSSPTSSIDFINFFSGTESPSGEANIDFSTTSAATYLRSVTADVDSTEVVMASDTTSTYEYLDDWFNTTQASGKISGGTFADNGDGTITVSSGTGIFREAATTDIERAFFADWVESANIHVDDLQTSYIAVVYAGGAPTISTSSAKATYNNRSSILLGKTFREGTTLHSTEAGMIITEATKRTLTYFTQVFGENVRASGSVISSTHTLNIRSTEGVAFAGLTRLTLAAKDTSPGGGDTFEYYYHSGGVYTHESSTTINDTYYDDGTDLAAMTANKYRADWVYVDGADGGLMVLYGQGNSTLAAAEIAQPPSSLPEHIADLGFLAAKIIMKKGASSFTAIESAYDTAFTPSGAADHGELVGLADNDHPQYLLTANVAYAEKTYDIVIATYSGTNIDYVCDGTNDQNQFQQAFDAIGANEAIFVKGGTYNFSSTTTLATSDFAIITNSAKIEVQAGISAGDGLFYCTGSNILISGFYFDGNDLAAGAVEFTNTKCILEKCIFEAFGTSTQITVQLGSSAHQSIVRHLKFFDNDTTNTSNPIYIQSAYNTIFDLKFESCKGGLYLTGSYNVCSLMASRFSIGIDLTVTGSYNVISNYAVYTDTSYDGGGFKVTGDRNRLFGFSLAMSNDNDGLEVPSGADDNTFSHFLLNNCGQDGSNAYNGIDVGGDRNKFSHMTFTGVQDKYPIEIQSTADGTVIMSCDSTNATGSVANKFNDLGTNTQLLANLPSSIENEFLGNTTFYASVQVDQEITASSITVSGAMAGATLDTGQGANELYDMNQNVQTTDDVTHKNITATYGVSAATGTFSSQVTSNGRKLIDTYNYAVTISTPNALSTTIGYCISPFRAYAVTITSITAHATGGTNVVCNFEERPNTTPDTDGTEVLSGDITVTTAGWIGGSIADATIPANSAIYLDMTSVSGDVDSITIRYTITKD